MIINNDILKWCEEYSGPKFHAVLCDPPYELGFMGKSWDSTGIAFDKNTWAAISRHLYPGAYLLAFGGTRTFHRIAVAIEDAGFEIRDTVMFTYGSGFPKSHDPAYEAHKRAEQEAEHDLRFVRKTYLSSPVYACGKCSQVLLTPLSEQGASQSWRSGAKSETTRPEQPSVERWSDLETPERELQRCSVCTMSHGVLADGAEGRVHHGASAGDGYFTPAITNEDGSGTPHRPQPDEQSDREPDAVRYERLAQKARGAGSALKPAWEPIIVARLPLGGTMVDNLLKYGSGALNIDGCRVEGIPPSVPQPNFNSPTGKIYNMKTGEGRNGEMSYATGRWPANLILSWDEDSYILKQGATQEQVNELCSWLDANP